VIGLSYAEIADSLETTLAAVKWRIYKARETVAAELAREGLDRPIALMPSGRRA
jgi:DNA-directed RNA polymerase specialized sigma24 family protein